MESIGRSALSADIAQPVAVWNVVFLRRPVRSWWDWLTAAEYRHVCAFGYADALDGWVVFDPCLQGTSITGLDHKLVGAWLARQDSEISEIWQIEAGQCAGPVVHVGLWCTAQVKRLVGLRSGAFTPGALRRDLVRAGARRVFHESSPASPPGGS